VAQNPNWKPVTDADVMIAHVVMPKAEESATAAEPGAAAAAPAEPEVAKKGKPEEKEEKK
jgi:hypothetical protein